MSLLLGIINLMGLWLARWKRVRNQILWLSASFLIAYLGAYLVSVGGTEVAIVTIVAVSATWIWPLFRAILEIRQHVIK